MVGFIYWQVLGGNVSSIKLSVLAKFASFINESLGSNGYSALHETEILFNRNRCFLISSDINILNRIMLHETMEGAQRVHPGVRNSTWLKSLRSTKMDKEIGNLAYLLIVTVDLDYCPLPTTILIFVF